MKADEAMEQARRMLVDLELLAPEQPLTLPVPELGTPAWLQALAAFFTFAIGATIPLSPYLLAVPRHPWMIGCSLAAIALFATGWSLAAISGRVALWGGFRAVSLGLAGSLLAYAFGRALSGVI